MKEDVKAVEEGRNEGSVHLNASPQLDLPNLYWIKRMS